MKQNTPQVKLLVLTTCLQCKKLIDMLQEYNILFESTEVDLLEQRDREELLQQMAPYNEKNAFPVVFIGNKAIIGFQKEVIMKELGIEDGR
ncbi:MAG: glutaredoxin domain-containing protein [Desulfopila sp.]|jgi:glutaredoxin|nr:glutaredoxin domain-containing protein [Desulfopila sp.]